tara:strand:+ start:421 stop:582 length:162 start_codon:yes stop_codon:yes gene_type:complete
MVNPSGKRQKKPLKRRLAVTLDLLNKSTNETMVVGLTTYSLVIIPGNLLKGSK